MKKQNVFIVAIWISMTAFIFSGCQKSAAENNQTLSQPLPSVSPTLNLSSTISSDLNSPIRKIDFDNYTYSGPDDYAETFTLKNGEKDFEMGEEDGIDLFKKEYADLTGDGNEDAILTMSIQTGGSSSPHLVYIYALKNNKPKVLWSFMTGDRAEGGLKKVYADNGELVVETFGDNKFENDKWVFNFPNKDKFSGYCCPTAYTKIRFKWNGEKFAADGKPELFDYDMKKETNKNQ